MSEARRERLLDI
jgi:hypothetical protein